MKFAIRSMHGGSDEPAGHWRKRCAIFGGSDSGLGGSDSVAKPTLVWRFGSFPPLAARPEGNFRN
jgi:hypothetical protein